LRERRSAVFYCLHFLLPPEVFRLPRFSTSILASCLISSVSTRISRSLIR